MQNEAFPDVNGSARHTSAAPPRQDVPVGDLGSGSDYSPFLEHLGVPSADMGTHGPYGVYHSAFDDFTWFSKFADPHFLYVQQMARLNGLQVLRMADADVLPFDYEDLWRRDRGLRRSTASKKRRRHFPQGAPKFDEVTRPAKRLQSAGGMLLGAVKAGKSGSPARLNSALRDAERSFLTPVACRTSLVPARDLSRRANTPAMRPPCCREFQRRMDRHDAGDAASSRYKPPPPPSTGQQRSSNPPTASRYLTRRTQHIVSGHFKPFT